MSFIHHNHKQKKLYQNEDLRKLIHYALIYTIVTSTTFA